ncbi:MAG: LAGLIDADG family homing endonuclease [Nitrososphaerales archaeon]
MPNVDTSKKFDSVAIYRIRKLLSDLSNKTGRGTELVSLYLPAKKALHEAIAALREESGTASNIKSDVTRNHVQDALTKTMARLRLYKQTPENGLVIFCGAIPGPGGPGNETIDLFEVLPQKPVTTYLYRCLAPETRISLDDGTQAPIKDLKVPKDRSVTSFDFEKRELVSASVANHIETVAGGRAVYRLTSESGRSIVATEDHPFFTPRGWIAAGELRAGDLTCVRPELEEIKEETAQHDYVIVDEETIRKIDSPPANIELTVRRLKERRLLPLYGSSPKLFLLSRLLGHLFSDGSFTHNMENRNGKPYSHFTIDFCVGSEADYFELKSDLARLGVKLPKVFQSKHVISKDGRSYATTTLHAKLRDTAICTLLRALGAPVGSKVKNCPKLPKWITTASRLVQREFLAGYMGGDGEAPRMLSLDPCGALRLTFHRIKEQEENGLSFARAVRALFSPFGVVVNQLSSRPGYTRKDGLTTVEIELRFKLSQANVLKICQTIGYRYSRSKSISAGYVGEYLRIKANLYEGLRTKMETAQMMMYGGSAIVQISRELNVPAMTAKQWAAGKVTNPLIRSKSFPAYEDWLELASQDLEEGLVWESIVDIQKEALDSVMDLTIGNESHCFFANGFLVHNCDDHFHLDPLRDMLREQNVIGVLSMDATEAGLGIVSGDAWEVIDTMSSGVSGKTRKGGQCVSSDTLVQLEDGRLVDISKLTEGSKISSYNFTDYTSGFYECADTYSMVPKDFIEIRTSRPQLKIRSTSEHRFFTLDANGVTTKQAHELKQGDRLLVTKRLPQPTNPDLTTKFPGTFKHEVNLEGRKLLRQIRINKGFSQKSLAEAIGLHQGEISQLERGQRDLIWEKLQKIVAYLVPEKDEFNSKYIVTSRILPEFFSPELLQLLGYIAGDGSASVNRISLYEQREDVAKLYSKIVRRALGLDYVPIISIDKRGKAGSWTKQIYFETRIYSKLFVENIRNYYPGLISTAFRDIPEKIHRLDNAHLACFIRGLFDAEGHVRKTRIGIAMRSGILIRQLQLLLLRFGIVSSYSHYTNRFGTLMHALDISDLDSIISFRNEIGFSAQDKSEVLRIAAQREQSQSYLNVPVVGSWVDKRAKALKIKRRQFGGITNFFQDQRGISKLVFQRVLATFEDELEICENSADMSSRLQLLQETVSRLSMIARSELVLAYISKIERRENKVEEKFIDIELPITRSFIGNGFVLHNSARRYERLREMELTDYFNRLAAHAKKAFLEQYQIKGLIVSGPGPTKDEFVRDKYLDYRLQNVVAGILDSGYAGREGVRETIEKSGKLLENVRVIEEKKLVQRFFKEINSDTGLAIYGVKDILAALKKAAVDSILINDDVDTLYLKQICSKCGNVTEKFVHRSQLVNEKQKLLVCPNCSSNEVELTEKDVVDYLADAALDSGANVEVISSKTEDGAMMKNFGGISAILRYRV